MHDLPMFRRTWLVLGATLTLSACSSTPVGPRHQDVSTERLLASMAERFPIRRRLGEGLDVVLGMPQLSMRPQDNRVATVLDVTADERLFTRRQYVGTLGFSSALRYEARDNTVRLAQVKIEEFRIDSLAAVLGTQATRLGAWVTQDLLENMSVYQVPASVLAVGEAIGVRPAGVEVQASGLRIALEPLKR